MSFFAHIGKTSRSYQFVLHVHSVSSLPCGVEALQVVCARGSKRSTTRVGMSDADAKCDFDERISFQATIYAKKGRAGKSDVDKKVYTFCVQTDQSSSKRSSRAVQLQAEIDIAPFASEEMWNKEITRSFPLKDLTGGSSSSSSPPLLRITFCVSPTDSTSGVAAQSGGGHRHAESISLSQAQPSRIADHLPSFSRPSDELSPEVAPRRFGADSSSSPQHQLDRSVARPTPTLGRMVSKRNMYGDLEDAAVGDGGDASDPTPRGVEQRSYAVDEDNSLATPPRTASPDDTMTSARSPPAVTTPVEEEEDDEEDDTLSHLQARSPTSPQARRTETQLFSQIMVDAVQRSSESHESNEASPRGAHLYKPRKSFTATPTAPRVSSRRGSTEATMSPHSAQAATPAAMRAGNDDTLAGLQRYESGASPSDDQTLGGLQSYADLAEEPDTGDTHRSSYADDADGEDADADGSLAGSSFTDRDVGLTVEDILSPGLGGGGDGSLRATSAPPKKKHGRTISMFNNSDGAAAVDQILRPQTTRGSAIGKFFQAARKISITRSAVNSLTGASADPTPASTGSSASRTPNASLAVQPLPPPHFVNRVYSASALGGEDQPAARKRDGLDGENSASGASRSSAQTIDDILDGANPILGVVDGGGSAQPSRAGSRSASPSRLSSSVGTPGQTMLLTAPSPRGAAGKHAFPHSSPAKHSAAHGLHRHMSSGSSPFSSLTKDGLPGSLGRLQPGMLPLPPAGAPQLDANGAEIGSYAAWKAQSKANKARAASRSANSAGGRDRVTPNGSLKTPANNERDGAHSRNASSSASSGSKTMPKITVSAIRAHRPGASLTRDQAPASASATVPDTYRQATNASVGPERRRALSVSVTPPIESTGGDTISPALVAATVTSPSATVTLREVTDIEAQFRARLTASVQLLCEQLQVPAVIVDAQDADPAAASPSHTDSALSSPPPKSLWTALKTGFASPASSSGSNGETAAESVHESPISHGWSSRDSFHDGVPSWPCVTLRCLHEWDAFAVSSVVGDAGTIVRLASRSWILSSLLDHLHQTCIDLCARSSAGQRQNALCFYVANLATLVQLVESYARSSHAPPPYPPIDRTTATSQDSPRSVATAVFERDDAAYEQSLRAPTFPESYASLKGIFILPQLPQEAAMRVGEVARARLRASRKDSDAAAAANAAPFPFALSLGVSPFTWFLAHLRRLLHAASQCLVEVVLTEVELVDPTSILSAVEMGDEVGFEAPLDQLIRTYQKLHDDLARNHVCSSVRAHLMRCILANLNSTLFNSILASAAFINMQTGMRVKIICTSLEEWASTADQTMGIEDTASESLARICATELVECRQLGLVLLLDKQYLTLTDLAAICTALTPVTLYHLLINYLPRPHATHSSPSAHSSPVGEEVIDESLLDQLNEYQTYFLSKPNASATTGKMTVLFPAWQVHARNTATTNTDEEDDDEEYDDPIASSPLPLDPNAIQSPFLDAGRPRPFPRLSPSGSVVATSPGPSSPQPSTGALLQLSSVPTPAALRDSKPFHFLNRRTDDEVVLAVAKG